MISVKNDSYKPGKSRFGVQFGHFSARPLNRPVTADVNNSRIWKRTPTWRLFSVSSFYGDLGKHNRAPTMLLVCVELDEI